MYLQYIKLYLLKLNAKIVFIETKLDLLKLNTMSNTNYQWMIFFIYRLNSLL